MDRPTASVAVPAVIFRGQYVYRTVGGTMEVIVPLLASAVFAAVAVFGWRSGEEPMMGFVRVIFALMASNFGALGLWMLWAWIRDRRVRVEINEDGILCGNRFWPWDDVRSFVGTRYDNGVCLEFTPSRKVVWGGGKLPTTPLLTDQQYVELARELCQSISVRFPHVVVALVPEEATSDS